MSWSTTITQHLFFQIFWYKNRGLVQRLRVLCHSYGGCDAPSFNLRACLKTYWAEKFWGHLERIREARLCSFVSLMHCGNWVFPKMSWRENPSPRNSEFQSWNHLCLTLGRIQAERQQVLAEISEDAERWNAPCRVAACDSKSPGMFMTLWEKRRETSVDSATSLHRRQPSPGTVP